MFWEEFTWLSSYIQYIYRGQHNHNYDNVNIAITFDRFSFVQKLAN